jgi:hypothetical protein
VAALEDFRERARATHEAKSRRRRAA